MREMLALEHKKRGEDFSAEIFEMFHNNPTFYTRRQGIVKTVCCHRRVVSKKDKDTFYIHFLRREDIFYSLSLENDSIVKPMRFPYKGYKLT